MIDVTAAGALRAEIVKRSLTRHRLVFLQMGAVFDPIREVVVASLGEHTTLGARSSWLGSAGSAPLVVTGMEHCAGAAGNVLGEARELVFEVMDAGRQVCLVSRAPRIAYQSVPGSSVLEDSALVTLPLLSRDELQLPPGEYPPMGWNWPVVALGETLSAEVVQPVLAELGQGLIAALDHALFEVNPKGTEGISFLSAREVEGLRGCGLVEVSENGGVALAVPSALKMLRESVAAHISATVEPVAVLGLVTAGLWFIERTIRNHVRDAAISKFGSGWRGSCLGGLSREVLRRAQLDTSVTAKSVADLRDPLEWLTLGELMELVRSQAFDNLGIEPAIWRKLQEQLVPIRNRVAHVRMLKAGDDEPVSMWASLVRSRFGG